MIQADPLGPSAGNFAAFLEKGALHKSHYPRSIGVCEPKGGSLQLSLVMVTTILRTNLRMKSIEDKRSEKWRKTNYIYF